MTGKEKEEKAYRVFENISENYDSANMRISLGFQKFWKKALIRKIRKLILPHGKILDVCCGTGDIALALSQAGFRTVGIDFSASMLNVAERRSARLNCPDRVKWMKGNAAALPFRNERFEAAAISFGLRNTADYGKVLSEMLRVVKPGGYVFCLDSFVPKAALIKPFYECYFHWIMPLFGGGKKYIKEYQWLWRSTRDFLTKEELLELMSRTGLENVEYRSFLFGACVMHWGRKAGDKMI